MAIAVGTVGYSQTVGGDVQNSLIYIGVWSLIPPFSLVWYRIWNAPARELGRRTPLGPARTRSEVRREMITKMTWVQMIATIALLALLIAGSLPSGRAPSNVGDWVILVLGGGAFAAWLWLVVMKLRLRR